MKRFLSLIMTALVLFTLCACSNESEPSGGQSTDGVIEREPDDMFTERDLDSTYDETDAVRITLQEDVASCDSDSVKIEDSLITLTEKGTYIISGTLNDGSIIVDASDSAKLQLVLDGADITSTDSATVLVKQADKVFVTLAEGSENCLANGGEFAESDEGTDAAVFSREDITFNGNGSLEIISPAGHGIVAKDDFVIASGKYNIECASHGINANDSIRIREADMSIKAGKDALHAENGDDEKLGFVYIADGNYELIAEGDGISASADMEIIGGSFSITAGGGNENGKQHSSDNFGMFGGRFNKDDMTKENPGDMPNGMENFKPSELPDDMNDFTTDDIPDGMGDFDPNDLPEDMKDFKGDMPDGMKNFDPQDIPEDMKDFNGDDMPSVPSISKPDDRQESDDMTKGDSDGVTAMSSESTVSSDSTSMKGMKAGGNLTVSGGSFTFDCADDCIHSNSSVTINGGSFVLSTGDDGIHADDTLSVKECEIDITDSYEGLEAVDIVIDGGNINITADDDGINSAGGTDTSGNGGRDGRFGGPMSAGNGSIVINGGNIYINASGDGIDANGRLEINGGVITVVGPTVGDTSVLDFDTDGEINGGTFFGTGSSVMAQSFTGGTQAFIQLKIRNGGVSGTDITVTDADGNTLAEGTPELDFQYIIISCPELVKGEEYTVTVGETTQSCTAE